MNMKRLLLAIVVAFVIVFGTNFLIHGFWLSSDYEATKQLWRPESEMGAHFHWMLIAQFLSAVTFVIIWAKGFAGRDIATGATFGLLMGLFQGIWTIINHVVMPVPGALAAKWLLAGVVQCILLGIVTALIYKPEAAPSSAP
jgi:hypothetical protein